MLVLMLVYTHHVTATCQTGTQPCGSGCCNTGYCSAGGFCNYTCTFPEVACYNQFNHAAFCSDITSDPSNCGSCNIGCLGQCVSGQCILPAGYQLCPVGFPDPGMASMQLVNINTDPQNCGGCSIGCFGGNCTGAVCYPPAALAWCPSLTVAGTGRYANLLTDPSDCGQCYNQCEQGICSGGKCFAIKGVTATQSGASTDDVNLVYEILGPIALAILVLALVVAIYYFRDKCASSNKPQTGGESEEMVANKT